MKDDKKFPRFWIGVYILAAFSAILYFVFTKSPEFSDWFNRYISSVGRTVLATVTNLLPFSLTEMLILLIPFWLVLLICIAYRHYSQSLRRALHYVGILGGILCIVLILFVWNFAPGYYGKPLDQKLSLDRREVSANELYQTALLLSTEVNNASKELVFTEDGASLMPYSYSEMNQKLLDAYERFCEKEDFINTYPSRVKPIMLSEPMSYTHITGVYTFFTGEANINVNFPDYTIPYTAAHELAHQRGIAREDEANMIAFLVCMESDDPYIRYSASLNLFEYVVSALSSADRELYRTAYATLSPEAQMERIAYVEFYEKYKENTAAKVSQATNDAYLQSQGAKEGTKSYGMVVDLAVAYYRPKFVTAA